jgi:hypothetical protein
MHQPLYTVPWTFFIALIASLKVMIKTRPDLVSIRIMYQAACTELIYLDTM